MKAIKAIKDPSEQNTAILLSSIGSTAMMAPYPYGAAIGGSVAVAGGLM